MRRMSFGFGKILFATTGIVGALMLIPSGDPGTQPATATQQTALSTSPELASFLDNAIDPKPAAKTADQVIAEVAATPEPGQIKPLGGLDLPTDSEITGSISSVQTGSLAVTATGPRELTSVRSPVNMRSGPSTSHDTLFVLQPDEQVAILERDGGWAKVEKTSGATGWVYSRYLGAGDAVDEPRSRTIASEPVRQASVEAEPLPRKTVKASRNDGGGLTAIRLRASPSTRSPAIFEVEAGTPLRVAERRGSWLRVVLPDGGSGWVRGR